MSISPPLIIYYSISYTIIMIHRVKHGDHNNNNKDYLLLFKAVTEYIHALVYRTMYLILY